MTRVRFLRSVASADWDYQIGQVVEAGIAWSKTEIPVEAAASFLDGGTVELVETPMETAVPPSVETAARKPRRTKRAGNEPLGD